MTHIIDYFGESMSGIKKIFNNFIKDIGFQIKQKTLLDYRIENGYFDINLNDHVKKEINLPSQENINKLCEKYKLSEKIIIHMFILKYVSKQNLGSKIVSDIIDIIQLMYESKTDNFNENNKFFSLPILNEITNNIF